MDDPEFNSRVEEELKKVEKRAKFYRDFLKQAEEQEQSIRRMFLVAQGAEDAIEECGREAERQLKQLREETDPILDFISEFA